MSLSEECFSSLLEAKERERERERERARSRKSDDVLEPPLPPRRKASLLYHPDKQVGKSDAEKATAETMFLKTKEAYELLSDSTKRAELDAAAARVPAARAF